MKLVILTVSAVAALTLTAGAALADMQPIPNPPEMHHHHMMMWGRHHHHHHHHMMHHDMKAK
jgi:Spy/CpxP family protein refolding chaperone